VPLREREEPAFFAGREGLLSQSRSGYFDSMGWIAFVLALLGGAIMAATFVTNDLPVWLTTGALIAWLLALVTFVGYSVREARSEGKSVVAAAGAALRGAGRFVRDFMP
jgi:hypothetical protein